MSPRGVVVAFSAAVVALVIGWFGGVLARDTIGAQPEVAIGVVDAEAGVPVTSSSPTPAPTEEPATEEPSASPTIEVTATPVTSVGPCPGTPPDDECTCKERKRNSRWVCPLFDNDDD